MMTPTTSCFLGLNGVGGRTAAGRNEALPVSQAPSFPRLERRPLAMMDMLTSILPGGNAKDNAPHGLTEANLRELNAGVNPHKERKLSNAVIITPRNM